MQPFDHFTPTTLPEALRLLESGSRGAAIIAGGTDLMLQLRSGRRSSSAIINIKRLRELKGVSFDPDNGLTLGALTTLRELTRHPDILNQYPVLAHTAHRMASEQVRSFATLGGNLCNASPSADLAPPLIAMDASARIAGADGLRSLPLEKFFLGPGENALRKGELLQSVHIPLPTGVTLYLKHAPRAYMDIAVAGVSARLAFTAGACSDVRIVLGAVAPVPLRARDAEGALLGFRPTEERFETAARLAAEACSPIDDVRGSAWYRARMVAVLTHRALQTLAAGAAAT